MQLCILAPLAVILYLQYSYVAIASVLVLLTLSIAIGAQTIVAHHLDPRLDINSMQLQPSYMVR